MAQSIYQFNLHATNPSSTQPVLSLANSAHQAETSLQVKDVNNDGDLNAQDDFVLTRGSQSFQLSGEEGLRALNYFVAPTQLRATHHRVELSILGQDPGQVIIGGNNTSLETLKDQGYIDDSLVTAINQTVSEWSLDGNIPISLITGARTFTDAENASWRERPNPFSSIQNLGRWLTTRGGAHLLTQGFATEDTFRKVFVIGSIFAALGGMAGGLRGAAYGEFPIWMLFTSNYVACELGIIRFRPENDAAIHSLANANPASPNVTPQRIAASNSLQLTEENRSRLTSNIEIISRRMDAAQRDRFFGFSRPFIFGIIAFVDPQSRGWFWHNFNIFKPLTTARNLVNFREKSIIGFFARMGAGVVRNCIAGGLPSMALGLGIAVTAGYGIWGLGNVWYPSYSSAYGPLPYTSSFTRTYSAVSALFSTTWLLSAAGDQLHRITQSRVFSPANFREALRIVRAAPVINRQGFESLYRAVEGVREYPVVKNTIFRLLSAITTKASNRIPTLASGLAYLSTHNAQLKNILVPAVEAPRVGVLIALGLASAGGAAIIAAYLSGRYHDDRTMIDDLRRLGVHI